MLCVIQLLCQFFVTYRSFKDYKIFIIVLHFLRVGVRGFKQSGIDGLRHSSLRPFTYDFSRRLHLPYHFVWRWASNNWNCRSLMLPILGWGSFTFTWGFCIDPLNESLHVLKHIVDLFFVHSWLRGELALMLFEFTLKFHILLLQLQYFMRELQHLNFLIILLRVVVGRFVLVKFVQVTIDIFVKSVRVWRNL